MKADDFQMSKVFSSGGDIQFVLPIFQREYAWEQEEWQTLWDDILEIYHSRNRNRFEHFLGSLVVIAEEGKKALFQKYTLVDGQQRLTSISILLCALRDQLNAADLFRKKINRYLMNDDHEDEHRYKILPTVKYDDRQSYIDMLDCKATDKMRSRIPDAYAFYTSKLLELMASDADALDGLFDCILSSLCIVFIELDRTDKPYKIFESLNHRGKALTQADLVRNYIAMRLPPDKQLRVFDHEWSKIEKRLSDRYETARIPELTAFLRHYLALHLGDLPLVDQVYNRFRDRIEKRMNASDDEFVKEIKKLNRFSSHYNKLLRPEFETSDKIKGPLKRLNILEATTAYPLIMYFYETFGSGGIDASEFIKILKVVENYLVRRFLAGEPTNYLNSMFASLAHELMNKNVRSASSLESALGERNYPSDKRLGQRLAWNRIYSSGKSRRIVFVLETLNKQCFDADIKLDGQGTVEHIMPQSLSNEWKAHLGESWQDVQREFLHTLGNLTIVTQDWNTKKLSNKPYSEKREALQDHGIHLNSKYFTDHAASWSVDAIRQRANFLADLILQVWPAFTEPPRSEGVKGKSPLTLTVMDERFALQSWRGMALQMVNCLHSLELLTDYDRALRDFEWWITKEPNGENHRYKQSTAGWWIQQNLSAEYTVYFCEKLAKYCGLSVNEWGFTYE